MRPFYSVVLPVIRKVAWRTSPYITHVATVFVSMRPPSSTTFWADQGGRNVRQPALPGGIVKIVRTGPQKQVVWVAAGSVIAAMTDEHALWNRADRKRPSHTMGPPRRFHDLESPVTPRTTSSPLPAPIGDVDLFPETLSDRLLKPLHRSLPMRLVSGGLSASGWQAPMNIPPNTPVGP